MRSNGNGGMLVYGGSFNPLHFGHLRMALECQEKLKDYVEEVEFMPSSCPPHKNAASLLPFNLRAEIIKTAIKGMPGMSCSEIEREHAGLSYTFEILKSFSCSQNAGKIFFLIGSQDFALLPTWWKGLRLPEICNLVVAPRGGDNASIFLDLCEKFWPGITKVRQSLPDDCLDEKSIIMQFPGGNKIFLLSVPRLDISATRIRGLWLCGRHINYLAPDCVIEILDRDKELVRNCWEGE